ncbi:hypothetical protein [Planktotalea arctica]|nr:hypothetical protein [Planktotalea arctica]
MSGAVPTGRDDLLEQGKRIGFARIEEGHSVFKLMRQIQKDTP